MGGVRLVGDRDDPDRRFAGVRRRGALRRLGRLPRRSQCSVHHQTRSAPRSRRSSPGASPPCVAQGRLTPPTAESVSFGWPLRPKSGLTDPGVHGISNFIDHDVEEPRVRAGLHVRYAHVRHHRLRPRRHRHLLVAVLLVQDGSRRVEIVAAAAGTIVFKSDGNFDRSCAMGSGNWNAVYVQHADGSIAFYGHMKSGSVTPKGIGETVAQGEFLGRVGSSGSSTGPHLHFEVHGTQNEVIDPWAGPCNLSTPTSWWASQRPYDDSAINALRTHDQPPEFPPCPQPEVPHERTAFFPGEIAYFAAYYRDQLSGQVSNCTRCTTPRTAWSRAGATAARRVLRGVLLVLVLHAAERSSARVVALLGHVPGRDDRSTVLRRRASGVWEPIEITDDVRFVGGVPNPTSAGHRPELRDPAWRSSPARAARRRGTHVGLARRPGLRRRPAPRRLGRSHRRPTSAAGPLLRAAPHRGEDRGAKDRGHEVTRGAGVVRDGASFHASRSKAFAR